MMTLDQVIDALRPFFGVALAKDLTSQQWQQYGLALQDVNPGDLDDAIHDLRKSHGFRNAPLPAEIFKRCDYHRKQRLSAQIVPEPVVRAGKDEGEWKTCTIKGLGSFKMHVLPDHHPALKRYACTNCLDTGWAEGPKTPFGNDSVYRCTCVARNPVLQEQRTRSAEYARKQETRKRAS